MWNEHELKVCYVPATVPEFCMHALIDSPSQSLTIALTGQLVTLIFQMRKLMLKVCLPKIVQVVGGKDLKSDFLT